MRRVRELVEDGEPPHFVRQSERADILRERLRIARDVHDPAEPGDKLCDFRPHPRARRVHQHGFQFERV